MTNTRLIFSRLLFCLLCFSAATQAEGITMNLREIDINALINTVAEVTKKTFVVDPRVKANVTVVSSSPMDAEQVYQVFLSILTVHGFTAVASGPIIKIIPQSIAKSEDLPLIAPQEIRQGDELVTQVIKVDNVSASQLIPLLRPLIPQEGHLVAYPVNNTLIISDKAANVNRITRIIRRVDQPSNQEIEIILLEHASAPEIARILTTLEQKNAAIATANGLPDTTSIIADERTNSVLISGDETTRLKLRTLVTHLDTPLRENQNNTEVVYLRYARAKELVSILQDIGNNTVTQSKADVQGTAPAPSNPAYPTKVNIQADESTNSLVITAQPNELNNLLSVIRQLDIRRAQVLVEAIIAEVSTDVARELGVQWVLGGSSNGVSPIGLSQFNNAGPGIVDLIGSAIRLNNEDTSGLSNIKSGAFLGLGKLDSGFLNFAILLRALSADSSTNVLATPSLMTLDNQEAEIVVGQNVPFITGQYTTTGTNTGITSPFQTIQREDVGLKLKVVPQINEGNAIQLQIEQEVSTINSDSTAGLITNKRSIKTTVIIEDGNMVVLGGLISEDLQQSTQKVPGLGDIPVVGELFRSQGTKKVKRSLMIFLHPVIVRDNSDEISTSNDKYSYMRIKQLEQRAQGVPLMSVKEAPLLPDLDDFIRVLSGNILND